MPWIVGGIDRMLVFCAADRTGSGGLSHEFDACSGGCYHHNAGWSSLVARWAHNLTRLEIPRSFLGYLKELMQIGRPAQQCTGRSLVKVGET